MAEGFGNGELWNVLSDLVDDLDAIKTLVNELKADHNAHLGAASMHYNGSVSVTDAVNTTAAASISLKTTK